MRLLSPLNNKTAKDEQALRDILRTQELNKASDKARKDLANSQADFQTILAKNRLQWALEEQEHDERVKAMAEEINQLESKRKDALLPVEFLKEEAEKWLNEAKGYLEQAKKKDEYNEQLSELLQDKLDTLGQQEQEFKKEVVKLDLRKQGIESQSQAIIMGNKQLTKEMSDFAMIKNQAEKDIDERKTSLFLWQTSLNAQKETNKRTEESLQALARQLEDERQTLQRAFNRLSS